MTRPRIKAADIDTVAGPGRRIVEQRIAEYGFLPGIARLLLPDPEVGAHALAIYKHLHLRPDSPMTRVQREMMATVVNGLVGGAP